MFLSKDIFILVFIVINSFINYIYSENITVENEEEFINALNQEKDSVIKIIGKIIITEKITVNKSITVIGDISTKPSIDLTNYLIFENYFDVIIKDINLNGDLRFINNKKVSIENSVLNCTINANSENTNSIIEISNFNIFCKDINDSKGCLEILNYHTVIHNSNLKGNTVPYNRIIGVSGNDKYLNITNSIINGNNYNQAISIEKGRINIKKTDFINCANYLEDGGGGVLKAEESYIDIKDSTFLNSFSRYNGGIFYINNCLYLDIDTIEVRNTTSTASGNVIYINQDTEYNVKKSIIQNVNHVGAGNININSVFEEGFIASLDHYATLSVYNYYGQDFYGKNLSGGTFVVKHLAKLYLKDIELNNIYGTGLNVLSLFLTIYATTENGPIVRIENCQISNMINASERKAAILIWQEKSEIYINNLKMINSKSTNSGIITQSDGSLDINNFVVDNYFSLNAVPFVYNFSNSQNYNIFNNVRFNNISQNGALFVTKNSIYTIKNSNFNNINTCYRDNNCIENNIGNKLFEEMTIGSVNDSGSLIIHNDNFTNIYGNSGFKSITYATIEITSSRFENMYFSNGLISEYENNFAWYTINSSVFSNINGINGSILNIKTDYPLSSRIAFINSVFMNNSVSNYGGIVYSLNPSASKSIFFIYCTFSNITASTGSISYALNKSSEPFFSNKDSILKENSFATNPSYIKFTNDSLTSISVYSGEEFPGKIACSIFDDYDNVIYTSDNSLSTLKLDNFIFFSLYQKDISNSYLVGFTNCYYWNNECSISNIKMIANPGKYNLTFQIINFGTHKIFPKNSLIIEVEIKNCNETGYINKDLYNFNIKSCYKPKCMPSCNKGKCVNDNICDCSSTGLIGRYCNEYRKLERCRLFDIIFMGTSIIMIFITIILFIFLYYLRDNALIKGGSVEFSSIILVGSLFNALYLLTTTTEKTKLVCLFNDFFFNVGFSLVFGAITAKTYRIYKIFYILQKISLSVSRGTLYMWISIITILHILTSIIWFFKDYIIIENKIIGSHEEYSDCIYPKSRNIFVVINFCILLYGGGLGYLIRKVDNIYKEPLSFPVYTYLLFIFLKELLYSQNGISVLIKDLVGSVGIIICNFSVFYFLFIRKIRIIYIRNKLEKDNNNKSFTSNRNSYFFTFK